VCADEILLKEEAGKNGVKRGSKVKGCTDDEKSKRRK
jgi:hypothetical protein